MRIYKYTSGSWANTGLTGVVNSSRKYAVKVPVPVGSHTFMAKASKSGLATGYSKPAKVYGVTHRGMILYKTNAYRKAYGRPALKGLSSLDKVAQDWTQKMHNDNVLSHNPTYIDEYPGTPQAAAENIASGDECPDQAADYFRIVRSLVEHLPENRYGARRVAMQLARDGQRPVAVGGVERDPMRRLADGGQHLREQAGCVLDVPLQPLEAGYLPPVAIQYEELDTMTVDDRAGVADPELRGANGGLVFDVVTAGVEMQQLHRRDAEPALVLEVHQALTGQAPQRFGPDVGIDDHREVQPRPLRSGQESERGACIRTAGEQG